MKVVLLHAFPLDERMWEPQLESLRDYEVSTPRLYERGPSIDDWAASLLDESDGDLVLVGASLGGYAALAITRRAPERVRALALVGARAEEDSPERRAGRADTIELIETEGVEGLWQNQRPKLLLQSAAEEAVARARELVLARNIDELTEAVAALRDRADNTDTFTSFEGPSLVAVGEGDEFFPPQEAEALAARGRRGRFRAFAGAKHLPSLEQPDEFNAALANFLADV
ncbi:MAG TPA: alpha/beta fold hydrolase [Gaiellaceae bacterium]|nr:alpha/beta fold hydrolase [Gaiellaceae bacterium]HKB19415.1 alpha/beta fold hydrolase [Gaiellaceae bacterium]